LYEEYIPTEFDLLKELNLSSIDDLEWVCEKGDEYRKYIEKFYVCYQDYLTKRLIKGQNVSGLIMFARYKMGLNDKVLDQKIKENESQDEMIELLTLLEPEERSILIKGLERLSDKNNEAKKITVVKDIL